MMNVRNLLPILIAGLAACAGPSSLEKGGLVPLKLDEEALSSAYTPRRMALLVGISEFDDPHWRALRFTTKDATDLAEAISSKQASSQEVIEAHLRRIEAVNPAVNAVTVVLAEQALDAAKAADRAVAGGGELPPFHGVPFTVKGNLDLAGTPTTHGMKALAGAFPTLDAPVVERLRAAGAIPIGRTNLPDSAISWHTDSELWGATINPWDRSRTPGASSGGEAAALATGMTPLGLGNDTLGSLRWPAQCCGISVLGRVSKVIATR